MRVVSHPCVHACIRLSSQPSLLACMHTYVHTTVRAHKPRCIHPNIHACMHRCRHTYEHRHSVTWAYAIVISIPVSVMFAMRMTTIDAGLQVHVQIRVTGRMPTCTHVVVYAHGNLHLHSSLAMCKHIHMILTRTNK